MADNALVNVPAPSPAVPSQSHSAQMRPSRGRRRGRGAHQQSETNRPRPPAQEAPRTFGGQLTSLHAEAPAFIPASLPPSSTGSRDASTVSQRNAPQGPKSSQSRPQQPKQKNAPGKRRASLLRSTAPDIATRTQEDISKSVYECAICTNEVSRNSKIWSCHTCWTVFHIGCIKKWSQNEGAAVAPRRTNEENPAPKQWRCPGCNLAKDELPSSYTCWCEKEFDPKSTPGLPPHSCGNSCGRERMFPKKCPHPCNLLCHAGPCPPCTSMGPEQSCFCGKQSTKRKCTETDYEAGWSCGTVCGDTMPCGDHTCPSPCHAGLCGACEVETVAQCYCGKVDTSLKCCDRGDDKASYTWTGSFECQSNCSRQFDCGEHVCNRPCHPQDEQPAHCPRSPGIVTHCPCGKTDLATIAKEPRKSCKDAIPNCDKTCNKMLPCGHQCQAICHSGDCLPCLLTVAISCRCGRSTFDTICHQGREEHPQCMRICRATLNCGRHECGERCCTGERKAMERQATKRKLKPLGAARSLDNNVEAEHICLRTCERPLSCGDHTDQNLCHRGPCESCKEAVFEDIACDCGRTVLQAPLPCGTSPPTCNFPCHRPKTCGHPQVAHNCHAEDDGCPKCPFLTEKPCLCGKKTLKNQPCWRSDVLCGLVCGKKLKCGSHYCQKTCHRRGECEDSFSPCQQTCGKPKKTCGHPHESPCHAPSSCKEDKPCPLKVMITCDCQRKKEEVRCNARAAAPVTSGRATSLKCDDECARLERNRALAAALHISDSHTDDHVPYSTATLKLYLEDVGWSHQQEETLRLFAADDAEKRLRFPPMKSKQRTFIHSIAEDFGFDGESIDPEPHRHVLLFKTPKFVAAPMKTLAQAARIRRAALAVSAPINAVSEQATKADEAKHEYNGFLLTGPKFGLTEEELRPHVIKAAPTTDFDIVFLTADDSIALLPRNTWDEPAPLTKLLQSLLPSLNSVLTQSPLAGSILLCQFDLSKHQPVVLCREGESGSGTANGWSKVASRKSAPAQAPQVKAVGPRPVYTVLGSKLAEAKRKKLEMKAKDEEVVDDWEQEMNKDEYQAKMEAGDGETDTAGNVAEHQDVALGPNAENAHVD